MNLPETKNVFIIVPCFNEEVCIEATIKNLRCSMPTARIVVVNDGSADHTLERVLSLKDSALTILDIPLNSGIGTAVQTGLLYAMRNGAEYAVKFDGDGQHPAGEIPLLLAPLSGSEGVELVIGSRFLEKGDGFHSTFSRRMGIRFFHILSVFLTGYAITDATSGFRAYNRRALEFAAKYYPAFDYPEPEECILFLRNRFRVKEVQCRMAERQGGRSSIRSWQAVYYMLKVGFAMIMEGIRPCKPEAETCR